MLRDAETERQETGYAAKDKARQAANEIAVQKLDAEFKACMKAAQLEVEKKLSEGVKETDESAFWIKYGEDRCAYIRESAVQKLFY